LCAAPTALVRVDAPERGGQLETSFETLLYEQDDGVATVTLNRPDVHNAFDQRMQRELKNLWRGLRRNEDVRAVILTGAGEKAFCSGIDREESIADGYLNDEDRRLHMRNDTGEVSMPFQYNDPGANINPKTNDMWKPVVAAVNGLACGGALYMLGEADIVIASEQATFFDPHVTYGMVSGFESTHLLQKLPLGETLRLALLGAHERMSAERAHQMGLVSEVVPLGELHDRALWVARAIASAPISAIMGTVRAIWLAHEVGRRNAIAQVSSLVSLGTRFEDIEGGQQTFQGARIEWRLR
jgi:enoyl-CoA hydratase/carnithine racemase